MGYVSDMRKIIGKKPLLIVACAVYIFDKNGRVLLQNRADDFSWGAPGGSMDLGETPEETARREVYEETGVTLGEIKLLNVLSGEDSHFFYPNGDEAYAVDINFTCYDYEGEVKIQKEEVLKVDFFELDNLPKNLGKIDKKVLEEIKNKGLNFKKSINS